MVWVSVGLVTIILGVVAVYWNEIKTRFKRSEVVVMEQQEQVTPKSDKSVEQIVLEALVRVGCFRYTYLCEDGTEGVIWAHTDEAAMLELARNECYYPLLRRTKYELPKAGDLVVYDEGGETCKE